MARYVVVLLGVCGVLALALCVMLLVGYVPATLHGPMNERIFCLTFGVAEGILLAVIALAFVTASREKTP